MKRKVLIGLAFIFLLSGIIYFIISITKEVSKKYVELDEEFILKKNGKVFIDIGEKSFEIHLTQVHNTSCPKDAMCEMEVRQVTVRINGEGHVLTALSNDYINLEGTGYNLYYIPTYSPKEEVFIISSNTNEKILFTIDNSMNSYNSKYSKRGFYVDTENRPNAPWYYTIAMGMQVTGGYGIDVEDVRIDNNNNVEIIVRETVPEPGSIVTQALTYPTCMVKFDRKPTTIIIGNTDEEIFQEIK